MTMRDEQNDKDRPLRKESREIRILSLLPGQWDSGICCSTEIRSLDDRPKYEALSYVWGDESVTEPIQLNGVEANVTRNLKLALLHLRKQDEPLMLWIDALCINQGDNYEKSYQVHLMGHIYRQCSKVYIWLGCDPPEPSTMQAVTQTASHDPFALLRHLTDDKHLSELSCFYREDDSHGYSFRVDSNFDRAWAGLYNVIQSPWWLRLWTVQEAVLAPRATMIFGHFRISWPRLVDAIEKCIKHWWGCCSEASQVLPGDVSDALHEFSRGIASLELAREHDSFFDLCELLQQYGHRKCKDPRDNIFGLLALVDRQKYPTIVPNYELDNATVFSNAAKAILKAGDGELEWLYSTGYDWQEPTLPSWVGKNFAKPDDIYLSDLRLNLLALCRRFYYASKNRRANIIFPVPFELRLRGIRLDTLQSVGRPISRRLQEAVMQVVPEWFEIANLQEMLSERGPPPHVARTESFWRTMVGGLIVENNPQPGPYSIRSYESADFTNFEEWLYWVKGGRKKPNFMIESSIWAAIYGRAFFITKQGYMGLSYPRIEVGDEVWVLYGGRVPFILRPQPIEPHESGARYYSFVSDCYLDGFMHGKGIDNPRYPEKDVILR